MKKYNTLYYLLFVLIVMGAFAAMAQNDYGVMILGLAATSFSIIFWIQLISSFPLKDAASKSRVVELACLFLLAGILAMRVFYIRFPFVEVVFGLAGFSLIIVYIRRMIKTYVSLRADSKRLAWLIVVFYSSLVLYLISMVTVPFFPAASEPAGMVAFALMILFVGMSMISKNILTNGERVSSIQLVTRLKDKSGVLATLFLLFTLYMGFSKIGVIPIMYADEFPQSYYRLIHQAETGREKPVDGKYKHEDFKQQYDLFVERTATKKK